MAVTLTAEQRELRTVVRGFFADRSDEAEVRRQMDTAQGYDPALWRQMAEQLCLQGMAVPEEFGGAGFGHVELGLVLEEAGRAVFGGPLLSTALAAEAIRAAGDEAARKELLPQLAEQGAVGAVAVLDVPGGWSADDVATAAERSGADWTITGTKIHVVDAAAAALLVVAARTADGPALFVVETRADGVTLTPEPTLDQTRKQARVELAGAPARLLGEVSAGRAAVERLLATGAIHLAAEQVGVAARALELAVEYSQTRYQYGRAIGSFQAIKHLCADVLTAVETARSAAYAGLLALDTDDPELALTAGAAKVFCSETATAATATCIQVHGGIGFTWEHPAHLYFKRAKASESLFGTPAAHRERLADALGLSGGAR
ncbi:acyl-CoA dehydrogenase family protein [Pseudonocardia sp. NPDC049154]|uniref:acyl-CoA dehydrogenase family protein n=1 Tax=Pseudonocardia sp. NPDC049154 TaxID=3155501 RepID=UPI0034027C94